MNNPVKKVLQHPWLPAMWFAFASMPAVVETASYTIPGTYAYAVAAGVYRLEVQVAGADVSAGGEDAPGNQGRGDYDERITVAIPVSPGQVLSGTVDDGWQEGDEPGIPGVRIASVEGLLMETDQFGRYHLVGVPGGGERGRNFILKIDPSTLPAGTEFTTDNPLLRRIIPGVPVRFDWGVKPPE